MTLAKDLPSLGVCSGSPWPLAVLPVPSRGGMNLADVAPDVALGAILPVQHPTVILGAEEQVDHPRLRQYPAIPAQFGGSVATCPKRPVSTGT